MNGLLLILIILGVCLQSVAQKMYDRRVGGGVYSFTAATALLAGIVHLVASGGELHFSTEFLGYSVVSATTYCLALIFMLRAISTGSLALTSLILQYSLLIPTVYGLIALGEPIKLWLFVGIAMLMVSLVLINQEGKVEKKQITLKWGIYVLITFLCNGIGSTVQKIQQIECNGQYKSEYMVVAMALATIALFILAVTNEKKSMVPNLKKGLPMYTLCGLANGAVNFMVLVLALRMPASVMFPVVAAGGVVTTSLVSRFVYKEMMSTQQKIGLVLGVLAIIALNL